MISLKGKEFMFLRMTLPISGCMDLRGDLFFFLLLYVTGTLLLSFVDNTEHGLPSSRRNGKLQFISLPFNVANITIKILSHLTIFFEMLNVFHLKDAEPFKGFVPEGLFSSHLLKMRYNDIFTRITEGTNDNDPNTIRGKDKHICNDDLVT